MSNRLKRKTLSLDEIERECRAIKAKGFDTVLIVTGEHETKVGYSLLSASYANYKTLF